MFEKDMTVGVLLDFYGDVLSDHTRSLLSMYYGEDLSLAEIAESAGISRQGVRAAIKRGEEDLRFLEEKLGLSAEFARMQAAASELATAARGLDTHEEPAVRALAQAALRCADTILSDHEEEEGQRVSKFNR